MDQKKESITGKVEMSVDWGPKTVNSFAAEGKRQKGLA